MGGRSCNDNRYVSVYRQDGEKDHICNGNQLVCGCRGETEQQTIVVILISP